MWHYASSTLITLQVCCLQYIVERVHPCCNVQVSESLFPPVPTAAAWTSGHPVTETVPQELSLFLPSMALSETQNGIYYTDT